MSIKRQRPGLGGTGARKRSNGDGNSILKHPTLSRNLDGSILTACRRALHELATARREYRDVLTPTTADAADHALSALEAATEIIEREVRHG